MIAPWAPYLWLAGAPPAPAARDAALARAVWRLVLLVERLARGAR